MLPNSKITIEQFNNEISVKKLLQELGRTDLGVGTNAICGRFDRKWRRRIAPWLRLGFAEKWVGFKEYKIHVEIDKNGREEL